MVVVDWWALKTVSPYTIKVDSLELKDISDQDQMYAVPELYFDLKLSSPFGNVNWIGGIMTNVMNVKKIKVLSLPDLEILAVSMTKILIIGC